VHAWHSPVHAVLQHTPSVHEPLRQFAPLTHGEPLAPVQAPAPLHTAVPAHSFAGSVLEGTLVQAPMLPATLHAWHSPVQLALQHTPSTQLPL
jgi:hypothetical protein